MEAAASQLLSKLVYVRQLGEGGGGEVFLYQHRHSNRYYAVKKMKRSTPNFEKYVKRAIASCSRLYHPNIVNYFEHVYDPKFAYLIFEYMAGGDLKKEVIRKREVVPKAVLQKWIRQLVSVLTYLGKKGIMHRDIKPDNILLTSTDHSTANIKLADFDTCRWMLNAKDDRMTRDIGTTGYMAPDVIGSSSYNSQVDVWSLGCLVFELVTWKLPFSQHTKSRDQQQREGPVFPITPEVPDDVKHFIRYCLVYDPALRPSALDLAKHVLIGHTGNWPALPQPINLGLADLAEAQDPQEEYKEDAAEDDEEETGFGRGPLEQIRNIRESESTLGTDMQDLETNLQTILDKQLECVAILSKLTCPMEAKAACDLAKRSLLLNQKLVESVIRTRRGMNEDTTQLEALNQTLGMRGEELTIIGTHFSSP